MNFNIKSQIKILLFLSFLLCIKVVFGQQQSIKGYQILSSNLGMAGSSNTISTDKGIYKVSQSIGQSSVIGTNSGNGYYLRQGYQQPQGKISVEKTVNGELKALVYPNPFQEGISIAFQEELSKTISVIIFDTNGKTVFSNDYQPTSLLELNLEHISNGTYFLNMISGFAFFSTKLIKNK